MKVIAIYPGRFQPFGKHHAKAFEWLQNKFGKNNTFIVTSNVTDGSKSPFNFDLKKQIIQQYGIPPSNIIQVRDPYKALELTSKLNPNNTAVVFMYGEKDAGRIVTTKKDGTPGYFQKYQPNTKLKPLAQHGYIITAPHIKLDVGGQEMSGTSLRNALKNSTPQSFKQLMGWYNASIYNQIKAILNPLTKEGWVSFFNLLKEGGAGGHMAHPFDIDWVKTGNDLIKVFELAAKSLQTAPASVKIDGVNASIRLVTIDGRKQFVLDRGSNKPLDVQGMTKADLSTRFAQGHGMIEIGGKVLDIFNNALPKITPALKKLKLWDNPNILLNIEYVAGTTNVLSYGNNFLAIHGLLEIKQVTPTRRQTFEVSYNKQDMQQLLDNLAPSANKFGYQVVGSVPTQLKGAPNFNKVLQKKYTINFGQGNEQVMTLKQGLANATIPTNTIKKKFGGSISALSKDVLTTIGKGAALSDYLADPKDYQSAVDGFFIYTATMELGDELLRNLSSTLGPVQDQEGIVIRDDSIYDKPFKITGRFIVRGLESSF